MVSDLIASLDPHSVLLAVGPLQRGLIGSLVIGFIVGVVAKLIVGGKEPAGCFVTIIIGIVGSFIALYVGKFVGHYQEGDAPGFIASTVGAIILLVIYHLIVGRGGSSGTGPTV